MDKFWYGMALIIWSRTEALVDMKRDILQDLESQLSFGIIENKIKIVSVTVGKDGIR